MRPWPTLIATAALLFSPLAGFLLASEGGWHTVEGFTFLETVGTSEGWVVVGQDAEGRFVLLEKGDRVPGLFTIRDAGSQQVMVEPEGDETEGERRAAPVTRGQIPFDVLAAAICRLYGQNLIVVGDASRPVNYSAGLLYYRAELPRLASSLGLNLVQDGRMIVVSEVPIADELPDGPAPREAGVRVRVLRGSSDAVALAVQKATRRNVQFATPVPALSVEVSDLTVEELETYLSVATGSTVNVLAPEPEKEAPAEAARAEPSQTRHSKGTSGAVIDRSLELARSGRLKDAARLLVKLARTDPQTPARAYNLLGRIFWKLGRPELARKSWTRSLQKDPDNPYARRALRRSAGLSTSAAAASSDVRRPRA